MNELKKETCDWTLATAETRHRDPVDIHDISKRQSTRLGYRVTAKGSLVKDECI